MQLYQVYCQQPAVKVIILIYNPVYHISNYVHSALGVRGDIYVCPRPSASVGIHLRYARLCFSNISYSFSPTAFQFSDIVTMDKTLN